MRVSEHTLIFLGMALGAGLGLVVDPQGWTVWFTDLLGQTIFIGALKMIVAPLIFFSILAGITSLPTEKELWNIGWRTLVFYFATTSVAVCLGLLFVLTIQPGMRGDREGLRKRWATETRQEIEQEYGAKQKKIEQAKGRRARDTILDNFKKIIENPFKALATANSLGIIFFAILLGIALMLIGEQGRPVVDLIHGANAAIMKLTGWIMYLAPFFIFCLVTSMVAKHGSEVFRSLAWYVITVLVAIAAHVGMLLLIVRGFGKLSPFRFLRSIREAWAVAFATRSSAATLPVTMACVEKELKVPRKISRFVLPLGATMNMDGTALYEGIAVIFLIQLFGGMPGAEITLDAVTTVVIFLTAVLASIGAAAVPDAGLITMVLVANAVRLDPVYIGMIFAVDAFLDMFRTSTNVMGDSVGSVVVARWVGKKEPVAAA